MLHLQCYKQTTNIRNCLSSSGVFSYNTKFLLTAQRPLKITVSAVRNSKHVGRVCFSPFMTTQAARMKILELQLHAHTLQLAVRLLMLRGMSFT